MNNIKILSYNIWFDETDIYDRLGRLIELIEENNYDVICLQEVLSDKYDFLKMRLNYQYYYPEEIKKRYDCVIISKYELINNKTFKLNTNMGRSLMLSDIKINDSILTISNCHFESEFNMINYIKNKQYDEVSNILLKIENPLIFCSDTNATTNDNFEKYFEKLEDAWIKNGKSEENKYTYDYLTNNYLVKRNITIQERTDRILFNNMKLICFNLLKKNISDHHGISCEFYL